MRVCKRGGYRRTIKNNFSNFFFKLFFGEKLTSVNLHHMFNSFHINGDNSLRASTHARACVFVCVCRTGGDRGTIKNKSARVSDGEG